MAGDERSPAYIPASVAAEGPWWKVFLQIGSCHKGMGGLSGRTERVSGKERRGSCYSGS